ncbi:MAG: (Fe-S)-binding protein [Dehalococcoidales bacterium]|nr:(Fe-S)-binding protein [Dehalococcoidales bacterium]
MDKETKSLVPPGLQYIAGNITAKDNILGASKKQGAKWAEGLNLPRRAETVFFAGCGYQYSDELESLMGLIRGMDKSAVGSELPMRLAGFQKKLGIDLAGIYRKVAVKGGTEELSPLVAAVRVLQKLGVTFGYLAEDEPCCGALLHYAGLEKDFTAHAQQTCKQLQSFGVKQIIGMVPSCTYALRDLLPKAVPGFDIKVKHFVEIIAENAASLDLKFPRQVKVTYHDPCQLARYLGLIEEPRRILRAVEGMELVEPDHAKGQWATCCGGGGGFEAVFPELSQQLATNRARELAATGAQIIVTNCPGCIMQLKEGLKELKSDIEVLDLAQVVAMAMGL